MKKVLIWFVLLLIVAGAGFGLYSYFEATNTNQLNEASPLEGLTGDVVVNDQLDTMDTDTREAFDAAVEAAGESGTMKEAMPTVSGIVATSSFKPRAHSVEGQALLIQHDGQTTVRFEDFATINGPNLHIYLSSDLGDDDFIDLGPIKATNGNINYTVPAGVDTTRYNKVLVWCVPFKVLFSYADLAQ